MARRDAVGTLTRAVAALREAVEIVDGAMRDVADGAHDLESADAPPPDLPVASALRSRASVAFEFAARAVLPNRLPLALVQVRRALKALKALQTKVLPLPESTAPAAVVPTPPAVPAFLSMTPKEKA